MIKLPSLIKTEDSPRPRISRGNIAHDQQVVVDNSTELAANDLIKDLQTIQEKLTGLKKQTAKNVSRGSQRFNENHEQSESKFIASPVSKIHNATHSRNSQKLPRIEQTFQSIKSQQDIDKTTGHNQLSDVLKNLSKDVLKVKEQVAKIMEKAKQLPQLESIPALSDNAADDPSTNSWCLAHVFCTSLDDSCFLTKCSPMGVLSA